MKSGDLIALATSAPKRVPAFPDFPRSPRRGFPTRPLNIWMALFVPAKTPQGIATRSLTALEQTMKEPSVVTPWRRPGWWSTTAALRHRRRCRDGVRSGEEGRDPAGYRHSDDEPRPRGCRHVARPWDQAVRSRRAGSPWAARQPRTWLLSLLAGARPLCGGHCRPARAPRRRSRRRVRRTSRLRQGRLLWRSAVYAFILPLLGFVASTFLSCWSCSRRSSSPVGLLGRDRGDDPAVCTCCSRHGSTSSSRAAPGILSVMDLGLHAIGYGFAVSAEPLNLFRVLRRRLHRDA